MFIPESGEFGGETDAEDKTLVWLGNENMVCPWCFTSLLEEVILEDDEDFINWGFVFQTTVGKEGVDIFL